MPKFTAALKVKEIKGSHVTLCFCDLKRSGKFCTSSKKRSGIIIGIEYWKNSKVTVALIRSNFIYERHKYYNKLGYTYDGYKFNPHITLSYGINQCETFKHLIGQTVTLMGEYARIF